MLGEILLKIVSALTPDDIRQMKAGGSAECLKWVEDIEDILHLLDQMTVSWHDGKYGVMSLPDVQLWADVREKLKKLRAALNEG
ncbi:MAG: hypothetical protein V1932_05905 [Chloroflexota bacterium]